MRVAADVARRLSFRALSGLRGGELGSATRTAAGAVSETAWGRPSSSRSRRPDAFWRKLGTRTRVGFGESYVDGDWDCDDLVGLFALLGRNLEATAENPTLKRLHRLQELRPDRRPRQTLAAAKDNIHAHYDLGERPVRADAGSDHDVLLRVLGAIGDDARRGAACQDPSCLRKAAARARRSRARDRLRLGRVRDRGRHQLRLSRHGSDPLTESGGVRTPPRRRGGGRRPRRHP